MPKNKVVSLDVFRKNRRLVETKPTESTSIADTPTCQLCHSRADQGGFSVQCWACCETQQAALRAYGLRDEAEEDRR